MLLCEAAAAELLGADGDNPEFHPGGGCLSYRLVRPGEPWLLLLLAPPYCLSPAGLCPSRADSLPLPGNRRVLPRLDVMLPALFLPVPGLSGPVGFPPLSPLRLLLLFQFNSRPTVSVYHLLDKLRVSGFLSSPARGELGELLLHETGPEPGQVRVVVGVVIVEVVLVLLDGVQPPPLSLGRVW